MTSAGVEADAVCGESGASTLLDLDMADLPLRPDRTEAASDLSATTVSPLLNPEVEFRGLSVLPGIFDLKAPRRDRVDSLVSALLKEGYD